MMQKIKLADVPVGKNFEIWGHGYTVLDGDDKGVLALEVDVVCKMPFRNDGVDYEVATNDFWNSSVRAYLEDTYIEELIGSGAKLDRDILQMELDLKCTLGQHEYGTARVHAGLLTLEQYGRYYDIIPKVDTPYWLATPWATPCRSSNTGNTGVVWYVYCNGDCNGWICNLTCGVRPTLLLPRHILVSAEICKKKNGGRHYA